MLSPNASPLKGKACYLCAAKVMFLNCTYLFTVGQNSLQFCPTVNKYRTTEAVSGLVMKESLLR